MPSWLLIIIVGVVLLILGVAVEAAKILIWIGIAVLVIGLIMSLMRRRGGSRV
jgi:membrane-bound ClpP family serine protease